MLKSKIKVALALLLLTGSTLLTSCNTIEDGSYVAPITQYEKIGGHWILNSVTQTDEVSANTLDLTSRFDFDTFGINLNVDQEGNPTTFEVTGNAPSLLPTSGNWKLANAFVNSDGSSAQIILAEKTSLTVTAVPGAKPVLEFKLTRKSNGEAFVSYTYNLTAQQ